MASSNNVSGHSAAPIQHPLGNDILGGNGTRATRGIPSNANPRSRARRGATQQRQPVAPRQSSASDTKRKQTKQVPRSVRWRLSLGLLTRPTTESNEKEKIIKSIEDVNALKLRFQRSRYDELEKKHYWKSTPMGIADESSAGAVGGSVGNNSVDNNCTHADSLHHVAPGDDPLSSALLTKNKVEDKKKLFASGIFGGKSARKSSGSMLTDSFTSMCSESSGDDEACKGSRWADFYSTREVLDVIEKDLVRLPSDHYTVYHDWRIKNQGWKDHRERDDIWKREQQAKEGRDQGEGSKGADSPKDATRPSLNQSMSAVQINTHPTTSNSSKQPWNLGQSLTMGLRKGVRSKSIENLASMLENGDVEVEEERKREENAKAESERKRLERISQILFVYAKEHPEIGYRQGMHEILSYILLALEMDMLEQAIITERKRWRRGSLSMGLPGKTEEEDDGGMAGVDSSGKIVVVRLLDPNFILHDAFNLFEFVMTSLAPAYDAIPAGDEMSASMLDEAKTERGESPMEAMTASVVSKIRYVARDERLFGHILYMPVPPQLYFAKWIRLMFGREVAGGSKSVMTLWGAFFDLAAARASSSGDVPITCALLDVLKTAAASMIILIRSNLLAPTVAPDGTMTGEPDPNDGIGYLMNYPPLKDLGTLVETISDLLSREKKLSNQSQALAEKKLSKHHLPSESYKISSIVEHPLQENDSEDQLHTPLQASAPQLNSEHFSLDSQRKDFLQKIQNELPKVYPAVSTKAHPLKTNIAESVGNLAEGLIDIGSKTVDIGCKTASAAMVSIENQYNFHMHTVLGHPLATNDTPSSIGEGAGRENDEYIINYRPHTKAKQKPASVMHLSIGEKLPTGKESPEHDLVEEMFESEGESLSVSEGESEDDSEDQSVCDFNVSVASKLSMSKSIGESVQKSPAELASMLEKSVTILMNHFNKQLTAGANSSMGEGGSPVDDSQHTGSTLIPEEIWNSMADVDLVRKELLSQAALAAIDHGRSNASLNHGSCGSLNHGLSGSLRSSGSNMRGRSSWKL